MAAGLEDGIGARRSKRREVYMILRNCDAGRPLSGGITKSFFPEGAMNWKTVQPSQVNSGCMH